MGTVARYHLQLYLRNCGLHCRALTRGWESVRKHLPWGNCPLPPDLPWVLGPVPPALPWGCGLVSALLLRIMACTTSFTLRILGSLLSPPASPRQLWPIPLSFGDLVLIPLSFKFSLYLKKYVMISTASCKQKVCTTTFTL